MNDHRGGTTNACTEGQPRLESAFPSLLTMPRSRDDTSVVLLPVGDLLTQAVNLDECLRLLVDRVAKLMQADRGTLFLVDLSRGELFSRAGHLPEMKQIRLKLGQGIAGVVAVNGEPISLPSPPSDKRFHSEIDRLTGYKTRSLLAVALKDKTGAIFGVLEVLNRLGGGRFTTDDEKYLTRLAQEVSNALEATSLFNELRRAGEQPASPVGYFFNKVIGESAPMRALYKVVTKAAATDATVLIRGESGCGKELFARAVHVNSRRQKQPFIKVDCAALPASLIENELFGHEKGAFTGADTRTVGKFEAAQGGTVFIDELGELPLEVQGKLLRVLQDRELERVGGTATVKVDVRIVAATNGDLERMVKEGRFREDLYYRIKVVDLLLPPLRERGPEDLERLARHFVAAAAKRHQLSVTPRLSQAALNRLLKYRWPGNVRELENCIESAVVLSEQEIMPEHLPLPEVQRSRADAITIPDAPVVPLAQVEKDHILTVLERARGNRSTAAKWLGIGRNTLMRKLKEFGVDEL